MRDLDIFTLDLWSQYHAKKWAVKTFGDEHADTFIVWLLQQEPEEQDFIFRNGYESRRSAFEAAHPEALSMASTSAACPP